jgi:hypothetical protein
MKRPMRWLTVALLFGFASAAASTPTWWAHQFVDSVGVNTHLRHAQSYYDLQFDAMKRRLLAAHITHIRDGAMDDGGGFLAGDRADRFRELGEAGIRATFVIRPMVTREFVQGFPARVGPAFEAFELPNEINLQNNLPWPETLRLWMPLFAQYIREDPQTARLPIVGPSIADLGGEPHRKLGDQQRFVDFGNVHKYYRAFNPGTAGYGGPGSTPCEAWRYGALPYALCQVRRISGDKPIICTEAGYLSNGPSKRAVTPEIQARYITRMLMLHLKAGIVRTFVYQLADFGTDEGGAMGLLTSDGGEKPAWRQLSALMSELEDGAGQGKPPPLDIGFDGDIENLESLLFAKRDGSYRLVLWLETPSFDPSGLRDIEVAARPITLALPRTVHARRVTTFDDTGAPRVRTLAAGSAPRFAVDDNLSIVDIAR